VVFRRVPTVESFLDEKLRIRVFGEREVELKSVRDNSKQTDLHQVLLWLVFMFSKPAWNKAFLTELLPLLELELDEDDTQTSFIEISTEAGILRSGKGAIHTSVGLRNAVVFLAQSWYGI
jgi:hypothetical protein